LSFIGVERANELGGNFNQKALAKQVEKTGTKKTVEKHCEK
jgi:hypothetical protein